jgi:hypothetical protein
MRLKSFIERFTRSFCKYDIFTIVYLDCLKRAAWWYFCIILIHFWVYFYVKMCAILCKNIVYLYSLIDVFLCKILYRIALFFVCEWVKYCGKVWVFCLIYDWNVRYFYLFGVWFLSCLEYNFICFYVVFCVLF